MSAADGSVSNGAGSDGAGSEGATTRGGLRSDVVARTLASPTTVAVSAALMLVGATVGSGALGGTPIAEAAGGALATDATPVAPAGPAFAIWTVIYIGLVALAVWQLLPSVRRAPRLVRLRPWLVGSMLLNAAWILSVQLGWLAVSVVLIAALVAVLARIFVITTRTPPRSRLETLLVDGTTGLYLGWTVVATVANVAAYLAVLGFGSRTSAGVAGTSEVASVVVLLVAAGIGTGLAHVGRGRLSVSLAMVWGLAWIVVARTMGDLVSAPAAITAATAAGAITTVTVAARPGRLERRA